MQLVSPYTGKIGGHSTHSIMNLKSVSLQNFVKTRWPFLPWQSKVSTWNFFQGPMDIKKVSDPDGSKQQMRQGFKHLRTLTFC